MDRIERATRRRRDPRIEPPAQKLNPGSHAAYVRGCLCPMIDNHYGQGMYVTGNGEHVYSIRADCPLHGIPTPEAA